MGSFKGNFMELKEKIVKNEENYYFLITYFKKIYTAYP